MNMNFFDKLYFGYVKKQISVGNRSDPMSMAVIFLSFTFALNTFATWMYILLLLPKNTTENIYPVEAIACSMVLVVILVLCTLLCKRRSCNKIIIHYRICKVSRTSKHIGHIITFKMWFYR